MMADSDCGLEIAQRLGMPVLSELPSIRLNKLLCAQIPYAFATKNALVPLEETALTLLVATSKPLNIEAIDELRLRLDKRIETVYCSDPLIQLALNECYHMQEGAASDFLAHLSQKPTAGQDSLASLETYDLLETKEESPIIRLINLIFMEAIQQGASDIHFEPFENDLKIRYRIDGVLQARHAPPPEYQGQLITRIKVLAKLDIAEHRLPQDGRIKLKMGAREIDFRVSTVPVVHGERVVLRILDKGNVVLGLEQLGMLPSMMEAFAKLLSMSEGIILVTGPTGSGKTTTLYSALWQMYSTHTNMMTIEDPVEYKLPGIAQMAVHPKIGLAFSQGLRSLLRQDPDVIMIGEIRDAETAEIAIQAALTGHLVLSTLHTNDAPSAVLRLMDMGIEPYLISSTVVGVLAQRLVRRICSVCREAYVPSEEELLDLGLTGKKTQALYRGCGCEHCYGLGYKGRHGVYELLVMNPALQSQVVKNIDAVKLRAIAREMGMMQLKEHGVHLVQAGITTPAEVLCM